MVVLIKPPTPQLGEGLGRRMIRKVRSGRCVGRCCLLDLVYLGNAGAHGSCGYLCKIKSGKTPILMGKSSLALLWGFRCYKVAPYFSEWPHTCAFIRNTYGA